LKSLTDKVIAGARLSAGEAIGLASVEGPMVFELFFHANGIRQAFRGDRVDLCSIMNAKSGACPEDCSYCAQSSRAKAGLKPYPLMGKEVVLQRANEALEEGARRFCIVTSGLRPPAKELKTIASMITGIRKLGLLPCATLGLLGKDELRALKDAGLERYHHNLETSRRFFPEICSSHSYDDKLRTIEAVRASGLSLCSGGIFGMGEDWQDRIDMALALRELGADSIPVNFLIPVKGTRLEGLEPMSPLEALKIVSLYRFLLPDKEIRLCGGRAQTLGEMNALVFIAGADGLLIGNYLTKTGRRPEDDLRLIRQFGLRAHQKAQ